MNHLIKDVQDVVFVFSLVLIVCFFICLTVLLIKKTYYRYLYNILPLFLSASIFSTFIKISVFAFMISSLVYIVIISVGYASLWNGTSKIFDEEKKGKVFLAPKKNIQNERKLRLLSEEERIVWYKDFCINHRVVSPFILLSVLLPITIAICIFLFTASDYKGMFAFF